jgi:very-short-patch-repair endonuclease
MFSTPLDLDTMIALMTTHYALREAYALTSGTPAQWQVIRDIYAAHMPTITARSQAHLRGRVDPYFVDWKFSPIEERAWHTIRALGTPLYPQVPAGSAFIDFANPYYQIGLELDGADYHDFEKDRARDTLLSQRGWRIFRITGSETWTPHSIPNDWEDAPLDRDERHAVHHWLTATSDGIITALDRVYFHPHPSSLPYYEWALASLDMHRLTRFPLVTKGVSICDDPTD